MEQVETAQAWQLTASEWNAQQEIYATQTLRDIETHIFLLKRVVWMISVLRIEGYPSQPNLLS